jgi:hypothetical protein
MKDWTALDRHYSLSGPTEDMFTLREYADHYHLSYRTACDHVHADIQAGLITPRGQYSRRNYYSLASGDKDGPKTPRSRHKNLAKTS